MFLILAVYVVSLNVHLLYRGSLIGTIGVAVDRSNHLCRSSDHKTTTDMSEFDCAIHGDKVARVH